MGGAEVYDLVIIGAGPGGIAAADRAAALGMRTVCIERDQNPGGVCLNVGCIPSKALLDSSETFHLVRGGLDEHGIAAGSVSFDLRKMMERKSRIVAGLGENVRAAMRQKKVELVTGSARFSGKNEIEVTFSDASIKAYRGRFVLLATGSAPAQIPFLPFDGRAVVGSTEALSFEEVPKRLGIIGAGYIGLELGSVWARLGAGVRVIEMMDRVAAGLDGQVARLLERSLSRQGIEFRLGAKVEEATIERDGVNLAWSSASGGERESEIFDKLLVAVGRRPLTGEIGLEVAGIVTEPGSGRIGVDVQYRTANPSVYAIGDLIAGPMLAHKASAEGRAAVECMAGLPGEVNYDCIPSVVYTAPEVAAVGMTEEEARKRGIEYRSGVCPFIATARARCLGQTEGFVKILARAGSGRILGIHIIGPRASEMIALCAAAIEFNATARSLLRITFPHPTLSEAIYEAAASIS